MIIDSKRDDDSEILSDIADVKTDTESIESKVDVIDGFHDVPTADSADNVVISDVVGNKTDTTAGDSLVALNKIIQDYTKNIDDQAVLGLLGTSNSLAYRIEEIEKHLHSAGNWFEKAGTPNGEIHVADRIGTVGGNGAFQLDAGNDTWGDWVQILGSTDTPARGTNAFFDPHEILIDDTEHIATYYLQFTRGDSGAAGFAAGTYTELVIGSDSNRFKGITRVQTGRAPAGSKIWARCMCPGRNTSTFDFYIGIHEYVG